MSILSMKQISKHFGKVTALDGIDLEVEQGDVYGFIGPNGAGKTTTIRILLGIIKASAGNLKSLVSIHGKTLLKYIKILPMYLEMLTYGQTLLEERL